MKLTTHLHPVPRSKNAWSYTSTPNTPSWRGAQLRKAQGQLYIYLTTNSEIHYYTSKNEMEQHSSEKKYRYLGKTA